MNKKKQEIALKLSNNMLISLEKYSKAINKINPNPEEIEILLKIFYND